MSSTMPTTEEMAQASDILRRLMLAQHNKLSNKELGAITDVRITMVRFMELT